MSSSSSISSLVGRFLHEAKGLQPFLPTYLHLLSSTIFLLYTGAHASLSRPSSAAEPPPRKGKKESASEDDDDDEVVVQKMEGLSPSDAVVFPLMAGATLASLYFLIKWLKDPAILNKVLNYYFSHIGLFFAVKLVKDVLSFSRSAVFPMQYEDEGMLWHAKNQQHRYEASKNHSDQASATRLSPLPGYLARNIRLSQNATSLLWSVREILYKKATLSLYLYRLITLRTPVDVMDAMAIAFSTPLVGLFAFVTKPWYLTNFLGFSFCYGSLQYMSPTTFWTGTMLLSALFFYDIYFVFFTPMMVTVATKLDVPIKLLFPRPPAPDADPTKEALAMLGLGDIVVPGIMIALALRFDLYLHYLRKQTVSEGKTIKAPYSPATGGWGERFWVSSALRPEKLQTKSYPKPYFKASLGGYVAGMVTTLVVMQVADHAQPALLYLVPGVLISLWGKALVRGDVKKMWEFTEGEDEEKKEKSSKEDSNKAEEGDTEREKAKDRSTASVQRSSSATEQNSQNGADSEKHKESAPGTSDLNEDVESHTSSWDDLDSDKHSFSAEKAGEPSKSSASDEKHSKLNADEQALKSSDPAPKSKPRRLVYFSITLPPQPSHSNSSASEAAITIDGTAATQPNETIKTNSKGNGDAQREVSKA
ncbi:MAG: hypothetical protein Q9227_008024 [Pyrenula ochraceoflavens]